MNVQYYTLDQLPDFTMAKYSTQESRSVDDILKQHSVFYRQLHRRGLLFNEIYTLLYQYDPTRSPGNKMQVFFRVEGTKPISMMEQFIGSTSLASAFHLQEYQMEQNAAKYQASAVLTKKSGMITPSSLVNTNALYVVDKWKSNEKGRLMGLFRLMKALDQPCTYSIRLFPRDCAEEYRGKVQNIIKWRKPAAGGMGMAVQKDENIEKGLKQYTELVDDLRVNPHFFAEISAYADDDNIARLLLDAAASEAVEEGNYSITSYKKTTGTAYCPLLPHEPLVPRNQDSPEDLKWWHALFFLKEIIPLACFPTLYPGESLEIMKETAPIYENNGLYLGKDQQGYDVYVPMELLPKHALLAGVPGSGKTYTMLHLAAQISGKRNKCPILVLEPAKQEYRALVQNPEIHDLTVFAPGGSGSFPLRINPFEFPRGMKLSEHIVNLRQVFVGAFDLEPPMPFLLDKGIENVYRACGWYPFDYNDFDVEGKNKKPYPTMMMLFDEVEKLLKESDYSEEVSNNLKTILQVRIGSLVERETGNVFNVPKSTFRPEEWMQHSCVLELESLGKDAANFLTLLLSTIIREYIKLNPRSDTSPRHVIFFEEAHNLIGPSSEVNNTTGNAKVASTKFIVDMLAEVRALKEAIVIADQLPTSLAPQVTKNTSLKIGLRITAQDDREMLASTMSADGVQLEQMALFQPGQALCIYEKVLKPFEIHIAEYKADSTSPDNDALYEIQKQNETYIECMKRDMEIMYEKYTSRKNKLIRRMVQAIDDYDYIKKKTHELFNLSLEERKKEAEKIESLREFDYQEKKKCLTDFLELVLEFGEYVRINRYLRGTGMEYLMEEVNVFKSWVAACSNADKEKYSLKFIEQSADREFLNMMNNFKIKR